MGLLVSLLVGDFCLFLKERKEGHGVGREEVRVWKELGEEKVMVRKHRMKNCFHLKNILSVKFPIINRRYYLTSQTLLHHNP